VRAVGIRELKSRLSEYLRRVQDGETILITDRGRVVAEIREPGPGTVSGLPAGIWDLARRGELRPGTVSDAALYPELPRLVADGTAAKLLEAERGSR
jgi:hypothetical protein